MANSIEINGAKLRREFEVRNISLIDVSERCGFDATYFSKVCRSNRIRKPAAKLLEQMYNIKYEDYKIDEPEEEKSEVHEVTKETSLIITEDTKNVLRDIIYSAVYEAVKKAWSE